MIGLSAAAAGAAVLSPVLDWSAYAKEEQLKGPIGIVGGGVAGLTAAYNLQKHGAKPVLFEASNRWGGRMFTKCDFYKGMFCERGGEFVDSNHVDLKNLLCELGLEKQEFEDDEDHTLYFFKGEFRTVNDILDPETQSGPFVPIANQIRDDAGKLGGPDQWTDHARKLDNISLEKYLAQFRGKTIRGKTTDDWVIDLIELAYVNENGLEAEDQSSLNLVHVIGTALDEDFAINGDSDECCRIKGGSSVLIQALVDALDKDKTEMKLNYALTELDYQDGQIVMGFAAPGGVQTHNFDAVILALPFTKLRQVKGLDRLNLSCEKLKCINKLGMGKHAKIMVGTTSRVWRNSGPPSKPDLPSDGSILSDLVIGKRQFQLCWDTSAGQQPTEAEAGILTVFLGGNAADGTKTTQKAVLTAFHDGLRHIWPDMAKSLDKAHVTSMFWSNYPYTLGSYSCAKVGQYTTMLDEAKKPALGGRLQFAGEHTAGAKCFGFMNGGVLSGNRAAGELVKLMALPPEEAVRDRLSSPATQCQESPAP
jgi:monoamine oxidase